MWQKDLSVVQADSLIGLSGSQAVNSPPPLNIEGLGQECEQANDADDYVAIVA